MSGTAKSASLAERLIAGDKRALARAITLIESDDPAGWELVREVYPRTGKARIVGFTGPPGVGKSTLIGALTTELRKSERQVAVLSIDPSSPFTRGALLGDRIRLSDHFLDPGVFIRSMASRGALGGLSEAALQVALAMDAAGKDDVLIETVGVGQAEIDIVDHADTIVLALMPGSGDSIQALKAGVMEIPDVIVVNKADHPMTDTMVREVRGVLALSHEPGPLAGADPAHRGGAWRGGRGAGGEDRRAPRAHRGRRARWRSAGRATCATRCSGSPRRGCGGGSRRRRRTIPRPRRCWSGSCAASWTRQAPRASCWSGRPMAEAAPGAPAEPRGGALLARLRARRGERRADRSSRRRLHRPRERRARLAGRPDRTPAPAAPPRRQGDCRPPARVRSLPGRVWTAQRPRRCARRRRSTRSGR